MAPEMLYRHRRVTSHTNPFVYLVDFFSSLHCYRPETGDARWGACHGVVPYASESIFRAVLFYLRPGFGTSATNRVRSVHVQVV